MAEKKDFVAVLEQLNQLACEKCHGNGSFNDADPGDCFFNSYPCDACGGSGFKDGAVYQLLPAEPPLPAKEQ